MEVIKSRTVAEVVSENYKTADVFKKYGIDFCCGGGRSLSDVCDKKGLNYADLESELFDIVNQTSESYDFKQWDLDFLIDYIVHTHHKYVSENIPLILQYSEKVARVHGNNYPENIKIHDLFYEVSAELLDHMRREEVVLFPYIEAMIRYDEEDLPMSRPSFVTVNNPIRMMEEDHENAGNSFKNIASLSHNFTPPDGACNTYRVLYAKLREFETDLHQHIHLENNILFPAAKKLEMLFSKR